MKFGTSPLKNRVNAINKLHQAGYKIGILIAPVIFVEGWKAKYEDLVKYIYENLDVNVKKNVFFEIIFMTYSYVHRMINQEAFPGKVNLYDQNIMTGRGRGKYMYKKEIRQQGEIFFVDIMRKYFPNNEIKYIV